MNNKSKNNNQSINKGLSSRHVFSENGAVFVRSSQHLESEEWSAINFFWIPVLKLEKDLR
ncbi:hypothetical protein FVB32_03100 [Flagellimonas hymeniacidonis]|uniref:Uncharacterized protein n=1 Tax=Flagellimonas hymeniacidonis TaxID=2603628 RepID=A0A5C8V948_9FLAO|nr:hypothetical protein [Flagellimonas hymeniacidonis]TXN37288.1 hypothetical protein FVB32_03100 [Flagellimonas hymeniacidonis]